MTYTKMHFDDVSNFSDDVIIFKMAADQHIFDCKRALIKSKDGSLLLSNGSLAFNLRLNGHEISFEGSIHSQNKLSIRFLVCLKVQRYLARSLTGFYVIFFVTSSIFIDTENFFGTFLHLLPTSYLRACSCFSP